MVEILSYHISVMKETDKIPNQFATHNFDKFACLAQ